MAMLINGKEIAAKIRQEIKEDTEKFKKENGYAPGLAVVIVGEDPASQVYVRNKHRACEEVGFYSKGFELAADTTEEELLALIDTLNNDPDIHGILVQLPLPKHLDEEKILLAIDPKKDVDAFHPYNVGRIMIGNYDFLPCTPAGVMALLERSGITVEGKVLRAISPAKDVDCFHPENVGEMMVGDPICWPCTPFGVMELLREYGISASGKHCVVLGRSNIVGKPQALLLLEKNGTVTVCHSRTKNLADVCRRADILVAAIGKPEFFDASFVKEGAVVIDVGMNRRPSDGKLCGDVDFASVEPVASAITPVPGGVGPMTITMLLKNTFTAAKKQGAKV